METLAMNGKYVGHIDGDTWYKVTTRISSQTKIGGFNIEKQHLGLPWKTLVVPVTNGDYWVSNREDWEAHAIEASWMKNEVAQLFAVHVFYKTLPVILILPVSQRSRHIEFDLGLTHADVT